MDRKSGRANAERLGKILILPLADVNVALSLRNALVHAERALQKASEGPGHEAEAAKEFEAALRDLLVMAHAATGAWLSGLETSPPPSQGPLQEAEVTIAKARRKTRKS